MVDDKDYLGRQSRHSTAVCNTALCDTALCDTALCNIGVPPKNAKKKFRTPSHMYSAPFNAYYTLPVTLV